MSKTSDKCSERTRFTVPTHRSNSKSESAGLIVETHQVSCIPIPKTFFSSQDDINFAEIVVEVLQIFWGRIVILANFDPEVQSSPA